ncbi:unnamed protein product [Cylicocyclus nassatus]|uniref:Uncharacterized protein n=1 Tax=Cylicocyclus nassatus TaxID=53992 RepID=A0AA36DSZ0_CYLNA|nr:unnamed protein product [Cylicocyclus nassatus]
MTLVPNQLFSYSKSSWILISLRPGSRSGQKREEDSVASGGGQGPSFVDERSLSPEPAATIMRDDTLPGGYDAIARAPHLTAS